MAVEVLVVYLQFGDTHQREGVKILERCVGRWFPGKQAPLVIIDNAASGDHEIRLGPGKDWIAGDNGTREFSGYEKGLRWLDARYGAEDDTVVVLANDTFHRSYGAGYLKTFTRRGIEEGLRLGALVGHVDAFPRAVVLEGMSFDRWVRTSLIVTRRGVLRRLLPLAIQLPDAAVFGDSREFFRDEAPLSARYREYLSTWLFATAPEGSEFKESWHSKRILTKDTFDSLKEKARCILSEHSLSARAARLGIPLFDPSRDGARPLRSLRRWGGAVVRRHCR